MSSQNLGDFDLDERLRALREATQRFEAPQRVETALLARRLEPPGRPSRLWPRWALAAAAMAVVATGVVVWLYRPHSGSPVTALPPAAQAVVRVPPGPPAAPPQGPRPEPRRVQTAASDQIAPGFIPLVPEPAWRPGDSLQVMRVSMPRSALQSFGLPVDEERAFETVRADIVVGQDMVARAIRLVR